MLAEATHEIERERIAATDPLSECFVASPLHENGRATRSRDLGDEPGDVLMVEATQNFRLGADPVGVSVVERNLEYQLFVGALAHDDEDVGTAAAREPASDDQAIVEPVAGIGGCRVD